MEWVLITMGIVWAFLAGLIIGMFKGFNDGIDSRDEEIKRNLVERVEVIDDPEAGESYAFVDLPLHAFEVSRVTVKDKDKIKLFKEAEREL